MRKESEYEHARLSN